MAERRKDHVYMTAGENLMGDLQTLRSVLAGPRATYVPPQMGASELNTPRVRVALTQQAPAGLASALKSAAAATPADAPNPLADAVRRTSAAIVGGMSGSEPEPAGSGGGAQAQARGQTRPKARPKGLGARAKMQAQEKALMNLYEKAYEGMEFASFMDAVGRWPAAAKPQSVDDQLTAQLITMAQQDAVNALAAGENEAAVRQRQFMHLLGIKDPKLMSLFMAQE